MSPTPELSEQLNLVLTLATLGLFGAFLSLTYVVERSGLDAMRWLLYFVLAGIIASAAGIGLLLSSSSAFLNDADLATSIDAAFAPPDASSEAGSEAGAATLPDVVSPASEADGPGDMAASSAEGGWLDAIAAIGRWMLGLALLGGLLLLPWTRRLIARLIPIDPQRPVHLVALEYALLLVLVSAATGIFVGLALEDPTAIPLEDLGNATSLTALWGQAGGFVLIAVFGVGLGVARNGRETLERLGLTQRFRPTWWIGMTLAGLAAGFAVDQLWALASPETLENVETITDALFGGLIQTGLPGALTIGLSAGIGEELLFRGAAQPRFGILLTSLLFAVVHTQYSVSPALLQIFVVGILLGLTRQRAGTLTAIGVHASYNFVLALLSMCDQGVLGCPW